MFVINNEICSQCGECQDICPCGAIEQQPDDSFKIDAEMCSDCAACQSVCPFEAIEEKEDDVLVKSTDDYIYIIGVLHNSTVSEEKRNQNTTA